MLNEVILNRSTANKTLAVRVEIFVVWKHVYGLFLESVKPVSNTTVWWRNEREHI